MKTSIPNASVGRISVARIDVGEVDVGPVSIGRLVLDSLDVDVSTGTVQARNLVVEIDVALSLDWSVSVSIPIVGDFGWGDTIDFGTLSATIPFGNVIVPGLTGLKIDIPQVTVTDLSAVVGAIRGLQLGQLVAEQVAMRNLLAPDPGFVLSGMAFGSATVNGTSLPHASVDEVTVGQTKGGSLPVGTMTLPGLSLPRSSVGTLTSEGLDVSADSAPYQFPVDAGILTVTLNATPSAQITMDELRIANVAATASLGKITLEELVLPYDVMNITLSDLGIDTISVPALEVS